MSKILLVLARVGLIQVLFLSDKGRLTQFVERQEPFIRRKIIRFKWFPPLLFSVNPATSPNSELAKYFAERLFAIDSTSEHFLAKFVRKLSSDMMGQPSLLTRFFKRPGSPWEMTPSVRRRDDWRYETDKLLDAMEISRDKPLVLLSVRDARYYEDLRNNVGSRAGRETMPDTYIRNPDLMSYSAAIQCLRGRGYEIIHFGFPTSPLPTSLKPDLVDYSGGFRTPKGDLLLGRKCEFMMCGASGAWALASLFNRPVAFSNTYVPFIGGVSRRDCLIPQLLWSNREHRHLTFGEMLVTGTTYSYQENCARDGIDLVKNTPDELANQAVEMADRVEGVYTRQIGDSELVERFSKLQAHLPTPSKTVTPIAVSFLRKHKKLLD